MAECGSNAGGGDDGADDGDGKRKVGCRDESDDDSSDDNDNVGVHDDGGVEINKGNDAGGGDGMSKTNRDDYGYVGGCNSNDDGGVHKNAVFHTKVVMRPIMVMTKTRVLQVTLLNLMKIAKWK